MSCSRSGIVSARRPLGFTAPDEDVGERPADALPEGESLHDRVDGVVPRLQVHDTAVGQHDDGALGDRRDRLDDREMRRGQVEASRGRSLPTGPPRRGPTNTTATSAVASGSGRFVQERLGVGIRSLRVAGRVGDVLVAERSTQLVERDVESCRVDVRAAAALELRVLGELADDSDLR